MGTWWFIRHGESEANAADWISGHRDVPLTARGVEQARALRGPLGAVKPERVLTSDLQRAWRTAEIAWAERRPAIERTAALRERHCGAWEGQRRSQLRQRGDHELLFTWLGTPPQGESQQMLARRALTWLGDHDDGRDTLLFAHGALIRCLLGLLDETPPELIGRREVRNAEIVERRVPAGRWHDLLRLPILNESTAPQGHDF